MDVNFFWFKPKTELNQIQYCNWVCLFFFFYFLITWFPLIPISKTKSYLVWLRFRGLFYLI